MKAIRASTRCLATVLLPAAAVLACGGPRAAGEAPSVAASVALVLPSNTGASVPVPDPNANATVVDFFGPTCEPCSRSIPAIVARRRAIEQSGGRLVLVAVLGDGETASDAEKALTAWGVRWPFLVDNGGASMRQLGIVALPSTVIVDRGGAVRWRADKGSTADDVVNQLK